MAVLAGFLALLLPAGAAPMHPAAAKSKPVLVEGTVVEARADEVTVETADGQRRAIRPQEVWTAEHAMTVGYIMPGDDVHFDGHKLVFSPLGLGGGVVAVRGGDVLLSNGQLMSPDKGVSTSVNGVPIPNWNTLPVGAMACARQSTMSGQVGSLDVLTAQHGAPFTGSVQIHDIRVKGGTTTLRAWDTVRVIMHATPGGHGLLRVAGLCRFLPAREVAPGTYAATFQCMEGVDLAETRLIGQVEKDKEVATRVGDERLQLVPTAPSVTSTWPANGETVPQGGAVYAQFTSLASYIDTPTVHLLVDGVDVTHSAVITPGLVYWKAPTMSGGDHQASLRLKDAVGNATQMHWAFHVAAQEGNSP